MFKKYILFVIACALYVSSCSPEPTMSLQSEVVVSNSIISVTRVGIFNDELAYGGQRGVYLIRDNVSGQEFIGVSGVGISERGLHPVGKTIVPDER